MTAILGFAEAVADQVNKPGNVDAMETIKRNGKHLLRLVDDILDLSKIEAGKMQVEDIECRPCSIIAEVASLMRVRADSKRLDFEVAYDERFQRRSERIPRVCDRF